MPTDLDVYFSIFKQSIKWHPRKSLTFDLRWLRAPFWKITSNKAYTKKNIESLAIEINKFQAGLTPPIISDLFVTRENNYNLRNFQELESSLRRTVKFGTETISYRGPQIWNLIPERLRTLETLNKFKKEIKKWKCDACPCRMCKT